METGIETKITLKREEAGKIRKNTILETLRKGSKQYRKKENTYFGLSYTDLWKKLKDSKISKPTFTNDLREMQFDGRISRDIVNKRDHILKISVANQKLEEDIKLFNKYLVILSSHLIRKWRKLKTENRKIKYLISNEGKEDVNKLNKAWGMIEMYLRTSALSSSDFKNPEFRKHILSRFLEAYEQHIGKYESIQPVVDQSSTNLIKGIERNENIMELWRMKIEELSHRDLHRKGNAPAGI